VRAGSRCLWWWLLLLLLLESQLPYRAERTEALTATETEHAHAQELFTALHARTSSRATKEWSVLDFDGGGVGERSLHSQTQSRATHLETEHAHAQELFTALHARTSHLYEARHNLLAPLTERGEEVVARFVEVRGARVQRRKEFLRVRVFSFSGLRTRINAEEERAVRAGTRDVVTAWKRTRIQKANCCCWSESERGEEVVARFVEVRGARVQRRKEFLRVRVV
jgi:hypothetical protein